MVGRDSQQHSFLDAAWSAEPLLKKDDFYGTLFREGPQLYPDDFFIECYTVNNGRPSVPPSRMMKLVLLQHWEGLSDRQALDRMAFDLRWKAVLGMEVGEPAVAQSTLVEFRTRLQVHDKMEEAFERFLERAVERELLDRKEAQVLDSTAIWGRGAVEDTFNLISSAAAKVLKATAAHRGETATDVARETGLTYTAPVEQGSFKGRAEINWSKEEERRAFLNTVVEEARTLLTETRRDRGANGEVREAAELLARILCQDLEPVSEDEDDRGAPGEEEPALELSSSSAADAGEAEEEETADPVLASGQSVRIRRGVARDRVVSVHDPEIRHGRKSHQRKWNGYKGHISVAAESEFVTGVDVTPANAGDAEAGKGIMEAAESRGLKPAAWVGDMAYSAAEFRETAQARGSQVCARVPPTANRRGLFSKGDFTLDLEAGTATCPADQTTDRRQDRKDGGGTFLFDGGRCAVCPLRDRCTSKDPETMRSTGVGRTISVHRREDLLQEGRAQEGSPAFEDLIKKRSLVERTIGHLMQRGLRQARYVGVAKTRFQAVATALVYNVAHLGAVLRDQREATGPPMAPVAAAA